MFTYPQFEPDTSSHEAYSASLQEHIAATKLVTQRREFASWLAAALVVATLAAVLLHYILYPRKA